MYKFYYNTSDCHGNNIFHETFSHTNSIYLFGREKYKNHWAYRHGVWVKT